MRVLGGQLGGPLGEAPVDGDVGVPPLAVELRLGDDVVVERPQGAVGEALVELLDLLGAQRRPAPASCRSRRTARRGRPEPPSQPDPGAVVLLHHRLDRGDEPAGGAPPADARRRRSTTRSTGSRLATTTRSKRRRGMSPIHAHAGYPPSSAPSRREPSETGADGRRGSNDIVVVSSPRMDGRQTRPRSRRTSHRSARMDTANAVATVHRARRSASCPTATARSSTSSASGGSTPAPRSRRSARSSTCPRRATTRCSTR